jgi:acetyl esterase/lipase
MEHVNDLLGGPGIPGLDFEIPDADISHVRRRWLDVPYAGISPTQRLDIYLPDEGDGLFPVVLYIHGGGFALGNKRFVHFQPFLRATERGYGVVSVDYRLSGEALFPAAVQDVKAAIRWVRAHAGEYRLDGARIAACGESAGGSLAAMVCASSKAALFDDPTLGNIEHSCEVQVGVDWFGPVDFLAMDGQAAANGYGVTDHGAPGSPESSYLGAPIAEIPDRVRLANPVTYLDDTMAPILIQHGRQDRLVPFQQSVEFARAIEERLGPGRCELEILEGADHGDPAFAGEANLAKVFGFLDRHLK